MKSDRLTCPRCKTGYPKSRLLYPAWGVRPCPSCGARLKFSNSSGLFVGCCIGLLFLTVSPWVRHRFGLSLLTGAGLFVFYYVIARLLWMVAGKLEADTGNTKAQQVDDPNRLGDERQG